MPIRPPSQLFNVEYIEKTIVETEKPMEPIIKTVEVVKEVEKIVYRDDPSLLTRLNDAYREVGKLKDELAKKPKVLEVIHTVEKTVDNVEKKELTNLEFLKLYVLEVPNYAHVLFTFILGALFCYLTLK